MNNPQSLRFIVGYSYSVLRTVTRRLSLLMILLWATIPFLLRRRNCCLFFQGVPVSKSVKRILSIPKKINQKKISKINYLANLVQPVKIVVQPLFLHHFHRFPCYPQEVNAGRQVGNVDFRFSDFRFSDVLDSS